MPFLHTLGRFALCDPETGETILSPGKPLSLLTWLALGDHREVSREQAARLLWDTLPAERALHSLRQAILVVRKAIGADNLVTTRSSIRLATAIPSDHDAFLAAVQGGELATALELYRGEFLAELSSPGGSAFDDWAERVRARLRQAHLSSATTHAELLLGSDQPAEALATAIELRRLHPDHQPTWRLLIGAHLRLRNPSAARQEAQELERLLSERNLKPDTATRELLSRFTGVAQGDGRPQLDDPLLVGRDEEFSRLVSSWLRARHGRAESVHLTGEAGIGKSRLLAMTADRLIGLGATVVPVRISPGDRKLQRAALAVLVDSLARINGAKGIDPGSAEALVALVPTLQQVFTAAPRPGELPTSQWLTAALSELLTTIAGDTSLVLLIDDLHWADPESLDIIGAAVSRAADSPLLVVTSSRSTSPLPGTVPRLLQLEPLPVAAIVELLTSLGDGEPGTLTPFAELLCKSTHGNPLLIIEALRSLLAAGTISLADQSWQVDLDAVREALDREVPLLQRIRRLGTALESVLATLAVSGHPLDEPVLESILPEARGALSALELSGLARRVPHGWEVAHDRFAETLLEQLPADEIARRRSEIAAVLLADADATPGRLVVALSHARSAGNRPLMLRAATAWIAWHRRRGGGTPARNLVQQLATAAGDPEMAAELKGAVPVTSRPWFRIAAAAALLALITLPFLAWRQQLPPYRLQLEHEPSIDWGDAHIPGTHGFVVPVSIAAYRRDGTIDSTANDTLTIRLVDAERASLLGDTVVAIHNGRAVFDNVLVRPDSEQYVTMVVTHPDRGDVVTRRLSASIVYGGKLHLDSGTLNGQGVGSGDRHIVIAPGDTIEGRLRFRYRSDWKHAVVVFCGIRSWLSREAGLHEFETIQTPVPDGILDRAISIPGPAAPGEYNLIFAFRAERNCPLLASYTNWTLDTPRWNDGPDIHDLTPEQLDQADSDGYLELPLTQINTVVPQPTPYAVQSIRIEVRP